MGVESFGSFEEMQESMRKRQQAADEATLPTQRNIPWGGYVFRIADAIPIFGRLYTREEYRQGEFDEEIETPAQFDERMERTFNSNYRFGEWFSPLEPEGELGSAHVVTLWPISAEEFADGQRHGWYISEEFLNRVQNEAWTEAVREGKITDV